MGSFFVQGCTYTASTRMCRSSIYTWTYLYPKGTLCCGHMDMARDGLYSENAGAIFCVQEQYLYRDVLMLRAQGCAGAVFIHGRICTQRARCAASTWIWPWMVCIQKMQEQFSVCRTLCSIFLHRGQSSLIRLL